MADPTKKDPPRRGNDRRDDPTGRESVPGKPAAGKAERKASSTAPEAAERQPGQRLHGSGYSDAEAPVFEGRADPPGVTFDGKRLDGPTFEKWVEDGNDPADYPPPSYADLRIVDVDTGLRLDGLTYDEWLARGNRGDAYPPEGFADLRDPRFDRAAAADANFRVDDEGYELDANGVRIPDRPPLAEDEIKARYAARDAAVAARDQARARSTVDDSRGATDRPARGAVGGRPLIDPVTKLRTDGPTYDAYVKAGYDGASYPPTGYADLRLPAGQWPANQQPNPAGTTQASSVLTDPATPQQ